MKTNAVRIAILASLFALPVPGPGQELKTVKLNEPDRKRGLPVMEALAARASVREWSDREVSLKDLSDLLWAADGINRQESRKRTAASAMNAQDVDIYVFTKEGVYLYDAAGQSLTPVVAGDQRGRIAMRRGPGGPPQPSAAPKAEAAKPGAPGAAPAPAAPAAPPATVSAPTAGAQPAPPPGGRKPPPPAPVELVLVSDNARFGGGSPELRAEWGAIDTGIVSQNIALFCSATGMVTRPRASIDKDGLRVLLGLRDGQHPLLNHPVGYPREAAPTAGSR